MVSMSTHNLEASYQGGHVQLISTPESSINSEVGTWYALHTRAKHEKSASAELARKHISAFLPLVREVHRWSDRRQVVEVPLFSCYLFVEVGQWKEVHHSILSTPGVLGWVGHNGRPEAIPAQEIDAVRTIVGDGVPFAPHAFPRIGQRVRIRGGALDGVEGIVLRGDDYNRLVVTINLIQRSLAVSIEGYDMEPL